MKNKHNIHLLLNKLVELCVDREIPMENDNNEFWAWSDEMKIIASEIEHLFNAETNRAEAREELAVEIWHFLNLLEMDQPNDLKTDNWRNWKYIRNSIADKYCPEDMRYDQEIVDRLKRNDDGSKTELTDKDYGEK